MRKISVLLVMVLALTLSCKKTVESEKKAFESNKKRVEALTFEYPSFKNVLADKIKAAEESMKSAETVTDEEAKIKKMSEVNGALMSGCVRNLEQITDLKKSLKSTIIEVKGLKLDYNERMGANRAADDADETIMKSDEKLKAEVNTLSEAESLSGIILRDLKSAKDNRDGIVAKVKERERKIEEEKKTAEVSKQKEDVKKVEAEKPVKCGYCGTLNPPANTKCKSCGAPLTKK